jgi:hypothetical protein
MAIRYLSAVRPRPVLARIDRRDDLERNYAGAFPA